jgi:hypothetical protein
MIKQHSRTRITHDFLYFFLHFRAVAMDKTFAASTFFLLKRTLIQTQKRVFLKLRTFRAKLTMAFVVVSAVDFDHVVYGFLLTLHSFMFRIRRLRLHINSTTPKRHPLHIRICPKRRDFIKKNQTCPKKSATH